MKALEVPMTSKEVKAYRVNYAIRATIRLRDMTKRTPITRALRLLYDGPNCTAIEDHEQFLEAARINIKFATMLTDKYGRRDVGIQAVTEFTNDLSKANLKPVGSLKYQDMVEAAYEYYVTNNK